MADCKRPLLVTCAALSLAACSNNDSSGRAGSCEQLIVGDLVITELMANPAGDDKGNEWFEVYNATGAKVGLGGVELVYSKPDGSGDKRHAVEGWAIEAGSYGVAGAVINDPELLPSHIHYGYERDLGDFGNSEGRLAVECDGLVIDEVLYADATDSASRIYAGQRTPDASGNDDLGFWCDSTTDFSDDELGTPGEANDECEGVGSLVECEEDGVVRPLVRPQEGDVVITEWMPNPEAGPEENTSEWFEVYFAAAADINGLQIGKVKLVLDENTGDYVPIAGDVEDTLLEIECVPVEAGSRIVVARSRNEIINGGLPQVDGVFDFSLGNSEGGLFVGYDGVIFDQVVWNKSTAGASTQLDPDYHTPEGNDDPGTSCPSTQPYGDGDLGTPGTANDECVVAPPEGMCFDGGELRETTPPGAGDIVITEFHANPDGTDGDKEWIEVLANGSFDLNGLLLTKGEGEGADTDTIVAEDCVSLSTGDYAVLAQTRDSTLNAGLPQVDALFEFALNNSDVRLSIGTADSELDVITWTSVTSGAATQLDPAFTDPADNDDEANWCDAVDPYGDGTNLGTPGAKNPACGGGPAGTCNDGGTDRPLAAPSMGDLVITEVMPNPDAVADADGEWFEVKNVSGSAVDINGLQVGYGDGSPGSLPGGGDCLSVPAGGYAVIAKNADMATNGGLPADAFELDKSISNSSQTMWIGYGDAHWDELTYENALTGASWSVDPSAETTTGNDDPGNICAADTPYGDGDLGSPGSAGPSCGGSVGMGMCLDGGTPRAIVNPTMGDIVISEWMSNPGAVADTSGEWFELYVTANVDLNNLEVSEGGTGAWALEDTLTDGNCLAVSAGSYVVIAKNATTATNGGITQVDYELAFTLGNSGAQGLAVGLEGAFLDEVDFDGSTAPESTGGVATQVDPASLTPAGNDNVANRCGATTTYGDGDFGTPGAANPSC